MNNLLKTHENFSDILERKILYYGNTDISYSFAAEEYAARKMLSENLSLLKMAELHMNERACFVLKNRILELESLIGDVVNIDCFK